jgi:hypothetical protein
MEVKKRLLLDFLRPARDELQAMFRPIDEIGRLLAPSCPTGSRWELATLATLLPAENQAKMPRPAGWGKPAAEGRSLNCDPVGVYDGLAGASHLQRSLCMFGYRMTTFSVA